MDIIRKDTPYLLTKDILFKSIPDEIDGFIFTLDPSGSFEFINQKDLFNVVEIYATPNWVENGELKIEVYHNEDMVKEKIIKFSRMKPESYLNHIKKEIKRYTKKYLS